MSRPLRELTTYLVLAYSMAIGIAVALPHAGINRLLSVLVPATAVLVITFAFTARGKRRELWRSFGLRNSGKNTWAIAVGVPMVLVGLAYGAAIALGVADLRSFDITPFGAASWGLNAVVTLAFMGVILLGEEIGWRGYLLPRVQQLTSRRRAAVLTGFLHGCFHLPLILIATTYDEHGSRWLVAPVAVATITAGGIFYAYLWDRTGSVWPVTLAHSAVNWMFAAGAAAVVAGSEDELAYVAGESGFATFGAVALVGAVFLARAKVWRQTDAERNVQGTRALEPVA